MYTKYLNMKTKLLKTIAIIQYNNTESKHLFKIKFYFQVSGI